ncbi:MAG: hypothetical protein IGQ88_03745, partial [Gloeomargaritaceae cyanobacterium C42_A2020_066]|nr:hypothetical protein [Gloeomargaritaceae cyanobacterium C42_A2020_066]
SFTRWLIGQSRELYAEFGVVDSPETAKVLALHNRFKGKGELTPTKVRAWHQGRVKPPMKVVREFMARVVELGWAVDNGKASTDRGYAITLTTPNSSHVVRKPCEPPSHQGFNYDYTLTTGVVIVGSAAPSELQTKPDYLTTDLEKIARYIRDTYREHPHRLNEWVPKIEALPPSDRQKLLAMLPSSITKKLGVTP